ncbi:MAG: hypothetical protein M0Z43_09685 [Acidithiobacillus sp.]|nr:hypothetical protein [Acidithiobacillus sp.]
MKKLILAMAVMVLAGCADTFVRVQAANEDQFIAKHGMAWLGQAGEQATENCEKYNKRAIMMNSNCDLYNPYYGGKECMTIWNCK